MVALRLWKYITVITWAPLQIYRRIKSWFIVSLAMHCDPRYQFLREGCYTPGHHSAPIAVSLPYVPPYRYISRRFFSSPAPNFNPHTQYERNVELCFQSSKRWIMRWIINRVLTSLENLEMSGNFVYIGFSLYNCLEKTTQTVWKTWKIQGISFCQTCKHPD